MKFFSSTRFRVLLLSASLLLPPSAGAFCGLQSCPRLGPHGGDFPFEAGLRTRVIAFDASGESGYYTVLSPRFYAHVGGMSVGAEVPWVVLHTDDPDDRASGFGNPLLVAQYAQALAPAWSGQLGAQLELPLGDQDHGLADDHVMLLPFVGLRYEFAASWYVSGMLAYSQAIGGDDDAAAEDTASAPLPKAAHEGHEVEGEVVPLFVNPHGDREAQWRAAVGKALLGRLLLEGFAVGQADLSESNTVFYTRAGVSAEWMLTDRLVLQAVADMPVTSARRSDAAVGVDVKIGW